MTKPNSQPEITVNWRATAGKLSPIWSRLWGKLLANKKGKLAATGEATSDGECEDGNKRNLQD
ncbi:hypothetical protein ACFLV5_02795 [Chloroflexota bacterium]